VAAGILNPAATKVAPTYNNLVVAGGPTNQQVLLTFDSYKPPPLPPGEAYIVKGASLGVQSAIFQVVDFVKEGFHISFPDGYKGSFMIEVSMFFGKA
jgi:hypothetical protein